MELTIHKQSLLDKEDKKMTKVMILYKTEISEPEFKPYSIVDLTEDLIHKLLEKRRSVEVMTPLANPHLFDIWDYFCHKGCIYEDVSETELNKALPFISEKALFSFLSDPQNVVVQIS